METALPPVIVAPAKRRSHVSLKLLFIALLVLVLHGPLALINDLRQERAQNREVGERALVERRAVAGDAGEASGRRVLPPTLVESAPAEGYRMVERALKHSVLVLTLVFTAFFLFETLAGLRLHAVHYGLVGAALCLFYLALLALGEVLAPGWAYVGAAVASSLLIVGYSASILRSYARAASIAALLAALMWFTRNVDWFAQEAGKEVRT